MAGTQGALLRVANRTHFAHKHHKAAPSCESFREGDEEGGRGGMKCKITNKLKLKLPDILIKATAGNGKEKGKRNWEGTKGGRRRCVDNAI